MTHPQFGSNGHAPERRTLHAWLSLGGLLGPVVFTLTYTVAGLLRPGYSAVDQAISDLGIGTNAWALNVSLIALGVLLVSATIAFYRIIRPSRSASLGVP